MRTPENFTLKVTVTLSRPMIWRHIVVPSDIRLHRLHSVIQAATGASDSPQHFFIDRHKTVYADPSWKDLPRIRPGREFSLNGLLRRVGDRMAYFSGEHEEWEHTVDLLEIAESAERLKRATCLSGNPPSLTRHGRSRAAFSVDQIGRQLSAVPV